MLTFLRFNRSAVVRKVPCNGGMTLFELLIGVVVLSGIAAIAIPMAKSQQAKTLERQSRGYLQTLTQAQKQHYALNQSFAESPEALEIEEKTATTARRYEYSIAASKDGRVVTHKARSRDPKLRNQVSVVSLQDSDRIDSLLCEANDRENLELGNGQVVGRQLLCPVGYSPLK